MQLKIIQSDVYIYICVCVCVCVYIYRREPIFSAFEWLIVYSPALRLCESTIFVVLHMKIRLFQFTDWETVTGWSVYSFFRGAVNVYSQMQNGSVE